MQPCERTRPSRLFSACYAIHHPAASTLRRMYRIIPGAYVRTGTRKGHKMRHRSTTLIHRVYQGTAVVQVDLQDHQEKKVSGSALYY